MNTPSGFDYRQAGGSVLITWRGRQATTLRGQRAAEFLARVEREDPQELMARMTGNFRHGNERIAKRHPRNRNR